MLSSSNAIDMYMLFTSSSTLACISQGKSTIFLGHTVVVVHLTLQASLLHISAGICNLTEIDGSYIGLLYERNKQ